MKKLVWTLCFLCLLLGFAAGFATHYILRSSNHVVATVWMQAARDRWKGLGGWKGEDIYANLRNAAKFRAAFPKFNNEDDDEIENLRKQSIPNVTNLPPGAIVIPIQWPGIPPGWSSK